MSTPAHPNPRQLALHREGKLPPEQAAAIARHLVGCEACRRPSGTTKKPTTAIPPELAASTKFTILGKLDEGGMGLLWKAKHAFLDSLVAIKVIRGDPDDPELHARFLNEIRVTAKLNHKHIVRAHDAEQVGDLLILVLELVDGVSLQRQVELKGRLSIEWCCRLVSQAAEGLQYGHEKGLVHRDIKPANLMVTRVEKEVKILDFGLARLRREQGQGRTQAQMFMGTPEYVAPEQATDARTADIRADIYSLGCTLFFLLTGRPPFQKDTAVNTILAHVTEAVPDVRALREEVPEGVAAILAKMTAKKPADRYQTPREVVQALKAFQSAGPPAELPFDAGTSRGAPTPPPVPRTLPQDESPAPRRRRDRAAGWPRWLPYAVAAGVVGTLGLLALVVAVALSGPAKPGDGKTAKVAPPSPAAVRKVTEARRLPKFADPVSALAFFPNSGELVVSTPKTDKGHFSYWDARSGKGTKPPFAVFAQVQGDFALSPGGGKLVTVGTTAKDKRLLKLVNARSPTDKAVTVGVKSAGRNVLRISADDRTVLVCNRVTEEYAVYDLSARKEVASSKAADAPPPKAGLPSPLAVSADHKRVAVGHPAGQRDPGQVRVWSVASGNTIHKLTGHPGGVTGIDFLGDDEVVTAGTDGYVRVWNLSNEVEAVSRQMHERGGIRGLLVIDGGRRVLTAGGDGTVSLWEVGSPTLAAYFAAHDGPVTALAVSSDGALLASAGEDRVVRIWDVPR